ncbi:MAG: hypothetical protein U9N41_06205 [Euryarchaeota archaeon]|nr:hypothetical protein [Euryarchaeota archaeon]
MDENALVFEGMEEEEEGEEEEIEEEDGYVKGEQKEYGGASKAEEMTNLMERLKKREKKEKAANLVSKLRGKKKANKKIMPYEIYATSGE